MSDLCPTCRHDDGTLNTEYLDEIGACLFGCGPKVDTDTGFCPSCHDHSTNVAECEECAAEYSQNFTDKWLTP